MGKNVHVTPHPEGWAVKKDGAERASSIHDTQADAVKAGREITKGTPEDSGHGAVFWTVLQATLADYANDPEFRALVDGEAGLKLLQ